MQLDDRLTRPRRGAQADWLSVGPISMRNSSPTVHATFCPNSDDITLACAVLLPLERRIGMRDNTTRGDFGW